MDLRKAIKTRKSVRTFSSVKVDWRKIISAIDMARFCPCAGNMDVMKFILVRDKKAIKQMASACQQSFVNSEYVVVAVSNDSKLERSYPKRGEKYARQQAGAAIQNFLLCLNEQGLATCWVGHFVDEQVKRALKIPSNLTVEALFPIGKGNKSAEKTKQKPKPDLDDILYFDEWENKEMGKQVMVGTGSK